MRVLLAIWCIVYLACTVGPGSYLIYAGAKEPARAIFDHFGGIGAPMNDNVVIEAMFYGLGFLLLTAVLYLAIAVLNVVVLVDLFSGMRSRWAFRYLAILNVVCCAILVLPAVWLRINWPTAAIQYIVFIIVPSFVFLLGQALAVLAVMRSEWARGASPPIGG
ncbi:MAG: hypothetical protein IOC82_05415 [Aestuariivirga sp.]|uniref:hypothetical protein n=1 Tax=Aestuariivirga sp. TaxID=2650926 RepID=UPI0025BD45CE|nr:hypothetical protein [Aestuariivirga sp.]MCA3560452.1 hypothetical protein [Aestuariivirga sp.]